MGWDTVVPIAQVRDAQEASPAPVIPALAVPAQGWVPQNSARKAAGVASCPTQGERSTWPVYPHPRAENLSPFGGRKGRECALLPTGGSREIALRDSMINVCDVIYEQRLGKADQSSLRRAVSARGTGQGCGGGSPEKLEKFRDWLIYRARHVAGM